jgi:nucleotide-binding universal stress UspA family protein
LLRSHAKREDVVAYRAAAEQAAREHLDRLVNRFGARLASARIELRKGNPEDTIPPFAVSEGIDLIVTGTRARDGIAGFLTIRLNGCFSGWSAQFL